MDTHQRMVADTLTKADIMKGNGALQHLLRTNILRIDEEARELQRRGEAEARLRSQLANTRLLDHEAAQAALFFLHLALNIATKVRKK